MSVAELMDMLSAFSPDTPVRILVRLSDDAFHEMQVETVVCPDIKSDTCDIIAESLD